MKKFMTMVLVMVMGMLMMSTAFAGYTTEDLEDDETVYIHFGIVHMHDVYDSVEYTDYVDLDVIVVNENDHKCYVTVYNHDTGEEVGYYLGRFADGIQVEEDPMMTVYNLCCYVLENDPEHYFDWEIEYYDD